MKVQEIDIEFEINIKKKSSMFIYNLCCTVAE